ncbi:hypothetical protein BRC72_08630 [Halobacteriales archaeon QH_7_66_36]|nr:MAG: hypothetical protein BRC72_08630 [Halobacteriales archaeon QH_7_66_36]
MILDCLQRLFIHRYGDIQVCVSSQTDSMHKLKLVKNRRFWDIRCLNRLSKMLCNRFSLIHDLDFHGIERTVLFQIQ